MVPPAKNCQCNIICFLDFFKLREVLSACDNFPVFAILPLEIK